MLLTDAPTNRYAVPGLERGLAILQLFGHRHSSLGAAEVARLLRLPRTTVFRLMQTLAHLGFLERDDKLFRLGPGVLRLGFEYLASLEITEITRPVLDKLREATGFSAQLAIRDRRDVVVIAKAAAAATFTSNVNVGTRLPAHATIMGRMLLADLAEEELLRLYPDGSLTSASPNTPRDLASLRALLADDANRGYAVSEAYYEATISGVAAPIRNQDGRAVAAISIVVPRPSLDPQDLRERLIAAITDAARSISEQLNYRPRA